MHSEESRNIKALLKVLCMMVFSIMISLTSGEEALIPTSFRHKGYLATGLSYAHAHMEIDLNKIIEAQNQSEYAVEYNMVKMNTFLLKAKESTKYNSLYKGIKSAFKPSRRLLAEIRSLFEDQKIQTERPKRQLVAALGVAGTLFNLGLGLYNRYEIAELHTEMQKAQGERLHIVELIKEESTKFNELRDTVARINATMGEAAMRLQDMQSELNILAVFTIMEHNIVNYNMEMQLWYHSVLELLQGRLSPHLLNADAVEKAMVAIRVQASQHGLHTLFGENSGFYRADVSYLMVDNIIHVYIHVPLIESEPLKLYEYVNAPVMLSKPKGPLMFIDTKGKALAVSESTNNGLEIDLIQLMGCSTKKSHLGNVYLCPNTNLARKDVTQTCLGTLHGGRYDIETLKVRCGVYFEDVEEFAVQISSNNFMFYSKNEVKLTKKCKNGTSETLLTGLHKIELEPFCQMFSLNYIFTPRVSLHVDEDLLYFPRSVKFTEKDISLPQVINVYEQYKMANVKLPDKIKLAEVDSLLAEIKQNPLRGGFFGSSLSLINSGMLLIVILYLSYNHIKFIFARRASRRNQPAVELYPLNH